MSRQILWTVLVFVVALGSGIVIGRNMAQRGVVERPAKEGSWLEQELKLTPEQREKMKAIWQEMVPGGGRGGPGAGRHDGRRQLFKERDDAIAALVPAERKADYDAVLAKFEQQMQELGKERERAFAKAVEQTKAILNAEQRAKYEEILKKGPFGGGRRPGTNPTTQQSNG